MAELCAFYSDQDNADEWRKAIHAMRSLEIMPRASREARVPFSIARHFTHSHLHHYLCVTAIPPPFAEDTLDQRTTMSTTTEDNARPFERKQQWVTRMAGSLSEDWARSQCEPGRPSENKDLNRVYTFLLWKIDWFVDTYPEIAGSLDPAGEYFVIVNLEAHRRKAEIIG